MFSANAGNSLNNGNIGFYKPPQGMCWGEGIGIIYGLTNPPGFYVRRIASMGIYVDCVTIPKIM